jgi:hypothetical protein
MRILSFSWQKAINYSNSVSQLIFVMVKCGVFFEVRTELLKYYLDELRLQRANELYNHYSRGDLKLLPIQLRLDI